MLNIAKTALQGAFIEHEAALHRLDRTIDVVLVKTPEDLEKCQALIIPGGGTLCSGLRSFGRLGLI